MRGILLLATIVILTGCTRPGDHPISENCIWIEEDNRALNLQNVWDRRHLRFDAITAEDVAIRWADKHFPHQAEYDRRRDECMASLFNGLANQHRVEVAVVRQYSVERDIVVDSVVILGFAVVYGFVAYYIAGRIHRRFPPEEPGYLVMIITMALGVGLVAVLVGGLWSIIIETLRLNSRHLSYRMNRIPLRQHWVVFYLANIMIFGIAAIIRYRRFASNVISSSSRKSFGSC